MGLHFMKDVPFHTVYIHALVRDEKGQKMSKSKGNVMDPLDMIDKFGTDALRFTLAAMAAQGRDLKLSESRIEGYRNFATKLWNASRYAEINGCCYLSNFDPNKCSLSVNKWIIFEVIKNVNHVEKSIEEYRFNEATNSMYQFAWATFCDWYLEFTKPILAGNDANAIIETKATTNWALKQIINTLNPIMPYLTEELWEKFGFGGLLIEEKWPTFEGIRADPGTADEMGWVIKLITEIRSIRAEINVPNKSKAKLVIKDLGEIATNYLFKNKAIISRLGSLDDISTTSDILPPGIVQGMVDDVSIGLFVKDIIDFDKENERFDRELAKIYIDIEKLQSKLSNDKFIKNAPENVILENKERLVNAKSRQTKLEAAKTRLNLV
jgi:valyl-tRNA synthetase